MTSGAGDLRERVAFDIRADVEDGRGNVKGAFSEQFTRSAQIIPRLGGETVMAARLAGSQPVTIRIRCDTQTALITPEWRARDVRHNITYNIRAISNPDQRREFFDLLCESGNPAV